ALLGDNGIFMYPTHPTAAPYHNQPLCRPFNFSYTAIFNVLGLPATQVPMGIGQNGVPVGLQALCLFIALAFCDEETAAPAEETEVDSEGKIAYVSNAAYPYGGANKVQCDFSTYNDYSYAADCRDYKYPTYEGGDKYCVPFYGYCCAYTGECYYGENWTKAYKYCPYCNNCQCFYPGRSSVYHEAAHQYAVNEPGYFENCAPKSSRIVVTKYGMVQGLVVNMPGTLQSIEMFLGIPYASPPTGTNRFSPTRTITPWSGIKMVTKVEPVCPQAFPKVRNESEMLNILPKPRLHMLRRLQLSLLEQSEDCLYLNIYTPVKGLASGETYNRITASGKTDEQVTTFGEGVEQVTVFNTTDILTATTVGNITRQRLTSSSQMDDTQVLCTRLATRIGALELPK
ncbi:hypothetical protein QYM36_005434, partial [Artemia franciscana]